VAHLWQTVDQNADPVRNNFIPKKLAFAMGASRAIDGYYFQNIHIKEIQNSSPDSSKGYSKIAHISGNQCKLIFPPNKFDKKCHRNGRFL
jgi:hypothetical protein